MFVYADVIADAPSLAEIVANTVIWMLSFVGALTVLAVIISGIFYGVSGANENLNAKAKKALIGTIIGLVLVLSSLAIVTAISKTI